MRNPDWVRDEVILAMDLYFRSGRSQLPAEHSDVILLSDLLNRLPIHPMEARDPTFRNPNGISMIMGNFMGIDPEHQTPGLSRNNHLQEEVWRDFATNPVALRQLAAAIEHCGAILLEEGAQLDEVVEQEAFPEGKLLTRLHLIRERSRASVKRKREETLSATGRLACEVCGFDFALVYGTLGQGFAECHHVVPLSELPNSRTTRLADLAIVCANCHRMLHRARPAMIVSELCKMVQEQGHLFLLGKKQPDEAGQ